MNYKRIYFITVTFMIIIALLSGCEKKESLIQNTEVTLSEWIATPDEHWQTDKNGEKVNIGSHALDDKFFCSVCDYQIRKQYADSYVTKYDTYNNPIKVILFAVDSTQYVTEYKNTYDSSGNLTLLEEYYKGKLLNLSRYSMSENNIMQLVYEEHYRHDGTFKISELDKKGNYSKVSEYNSDGTINTVYLYNNIYDESGNLISWTKREEFFVNETLDTLKEYEYNGEEEKIYLKKETFFYDDGSRQETEYSALKDELSTITYNSDNEITSHSHCEHVYDENYNKIAFRQYINGKLNFEEEYSINPDNNARYKSKEVSYSSHSMHVIIFSKNREVVSDIVYTLDGSKILEKYK